MSLWLSERKTAGLWKGGLWKSQQGIIDDGTGYVEAEYVIEDYVEGEIEEWQ